jgi:hypothetical protein
MRRTWHKIRMHIQFNKRDYMGGTVVDWRVILKWIMRFHGLDWIHLAQDSVQWRVLLVIGIYLLTIIFSALQKAHLHRMCSLVNYVVSLLVYS